MPERPRGLFDAEYGSGVFVKQTDGIPCDLLFRVRPNRKLRLAPGPYKGRGPHPKRGSIFRLSDPTTWPAPDEEWEFEDQKLVPMKIKRRGNLHFEDAPDRAITLLRVEQLKARKTRRDPGVIWLGYCGEEKLPRRSALWRQYLSRYVVQHWYRFINQSLHWKMPQFSTPEQGELWSALMMIASWQLWLARCAAKDNPRPWQKPQPPEKMTPGRVHQAMGGVLAGVGIPASEPKPRGISPGWSLGSTRAKRIRFDVVKKRPKETNEVKKQAQTLSQASP